MIVCYSACWTDVRMSREMVAHLPKLIKTRIIQLCSCWLLMFVQNIHSSLNQGKRTAGIEHDRHVFRLVPLLSFCNRTLHMASSLSIIFTPLPYSPSCNVTLVPASSNSSEQITVNINSMFSLESPVNLFDQRMQRMNWTNYSSVNRTLLKSDILRLPVTITLGQSNLPAFELLITNISKGKSKRARSRLFWLTHRSRSMSCPSLSLLDRQSRTMVYRRDLSLWWLSVMSTRCWWSGVFEWVNVETVLSNAFICLSSRIDLPTHSAEIGTNDSRWCGDDDYRPRTALDCQFSEHGRCVRLLSKKTPAATSVYLFSRIDQWRLGTIRHWLSSLWQLADQSTKPDGSGDRWCQWTHAHHNCSTESVIFLVSSSFSSFSFFLSLFRLFVMILFWYFVFIKIFTISHPHFGESMPGPIACETGWFFSISRDTTERWGWTN